MVARTVQVARCHFERREKSFSSELPTSQDKGGFETRPYVNSDSASHDFKRPKQLERFERLERLELA